MFRIEVKDPKLYCLKCSLSHKHRLLHKLLIVLPDCVQNIWTNPTAFQPPQADIQRDKFRI